jgi:ubiquinone/menaquinone biosynthesis C-methylase UbiE
MSAVKPNAQYNLTTPESLSTRIIARVRQQMFSIFMEALVPTIEDTVLDIGVTSDQSYGWSNYFEALYPWKDRITAAGIDDARFLEQSYPGLRFIVADGRDLPFADRSFDLVHSSAVLEHVGSFENQARMVAECLRVARRGVCLTTPNRWFPIEFHTQLPLVHWLPKPACRAVFRRLGLGFFAEEVNLNLMTGRELRRIAAYHRGWSFRMLSPRLLGWPSNLVIVGSRIAEATPVTMPS